MGPIAAARGSPFRIGQAKDVAIMDLETLFGAGQFLRQYPYKFAVAHRGTAALGDLRRSSGLLDPGKIIAKSSSQIAAHYAPEGGFFVQRNSAMAHYRAGATLEFENAQKDHQAIRRLCSSVEIELGLPTETLWCSLFVSPVGRALAKHFDHVEVLVVQIAGHKRWWLAYNTEVAFPCDTSAPLKDFKRPNPSYFPARFARSMPPDTMIVDMRPGSALLVPRGCWHRTQSIEPSISISIGLPIESALSVLLKELRSRLIGDPRWREPFFAATVDLAARSRSRRRDLLLELSHIVHEQSLREAARPVSKRSLGRRRATQSRLARSN
jgi:hypothetical protein